MDIFTSLEVRWFLDDEAAEAARALFRDVPVQGAREDRYLVTGRDDLGFKARVEQGMPAKVETKYLLASLGLAPLHARAVGEIERWRKLSLAVEDPGLEKDGEWIHVKKSRRLRRFERCNAELTEIVVAEGARRATTLGLEAYGDLDVLRSVCAELLDVTPALRLGPESSASYPRWLARGREAT